MLNAERRTSHIRGTRHAYTFAMAAPAQMITPWPERLIRELEANDQRARSLAAQLTLEQLNWQPAPGAWSIGQCLEHLAIANELYLDAIAAALEGKSGKAVQSLAPGRFSRWFIRSFIEPSPQTKRAPAPKKIRPNSQVPTTVLDRFLRSNEKAREVVRRAAGCNVNRIRFKNPFIRGIRFTVGTGLEIISGHERRHLLQGDNVRSAPEFPRMTAAVVL